MIDNFWAVVPAGGKGSRFASTNQDKNKLMEILGGYCVLTHVVARMLRVPGCEGVVVVTPTDSDCYKTNLQLQLRSSYKNIVFADAGYDRQESVKNGLLKVPKDTKKVVVHDGARPLVNIEDIMSVVQTVDGNVVGAAVCTPVYDTLKRVNQGFAHSTTDRTAMRLVQTPQAFDFNALLRAHLWYESPHVRTVDDTQLIEESGIGQVRLIPGSWDNIKITVAQDLILAEALLELQEKKFCLELPEKEFWYSTYG